MGISVAFFLDRHRSSQKKICFNRSNDRARGGIMWAKRKKNNNLDHRKQGKMRAHTWTDAILTASDIVTVVSSIVQPLSHLLEQKLNRPCRYQPTEPSNNDIFPPHSFISSSSKWKRNIYIKSKAYFIMFKLTIPMTQITSHKIKSEQTQQQHKKYHRKEQTIVKWATKNWAPDAEKMKNKKKKKRRRIRKKQWKRNEKQNAIQENEHQALLLPSSSPPQQSRKTNEQIKSL